MTPMTPLSPITPLTPIGWSGFRFFLEIDDIHKPILCSFGGVEDDECIRNANFSLSVTAPSDLNFYS